MNKALIVARWEFITTVTRVPYIVAVVAMPLFYGGMFTVAGLAGRNAAATSARTPAAIVDQAHIVDLQYAAERAAERDRPPLPGAEMMELAARRSPAAAAVVEEMTAEPLPLRPYGSVDSAIEALRQRQVSAVFVIAPDYMKSGAITSYARTANMFGQQADRQRQTQVGDAIRAGILKKVAGSDPDLVARTFGPAAHITRMQMNGKGELESGGDGGGAGAIAGTFGLSLLLTMSIFMSAGYLQQATLADRSNRMIEILFSSIDPDSLVLGKLIGLGGAGVLQILIYLVLLILPGAAVLSIFPVSIAKIALACAYFVIGYLIFACLMIGTGMLGRTAQEGAQLSAIWMLMASTPWFFVANISSNPMGLAARLFSFFPLTSAIAMIMRIMNGDVPPLEIALSLAVDAIAILVTFKGASRIFRASALMYGKRANLPELLRWLRAG